MGSTTEEADMELEVSIVFYMSSIFFETRNFKQLKSDFSSKGMEEFWVLYRSYELEKYLKIKEELILKNVIKFDKNKEFVKHLDLKDEYNKTPRKTPNKTLARSGA